MNDERALLAAYAAHGMDETHRLVLADWLEEHGDPERADFVRLSVALDRGRDGVGPMEEDEPRWARMAARRHLLWLKNRKGWLGPLAENNNRE